MCCSSGAKCDNRDPDPSVPATGGRNKWEEAALKIERCTCVCKVQHVTWFELCVIMAEVSTAGSTEDDSALAPSVQRWSAPAIAASTIIKHNIYKHRRMQQTGQLPAPDQALIRTCTALPLDPIASSPLPSCQAKHITRSFLSDRHKYSDDSLMGGNDCPILRTQPSAIRQSAVSTALLSSPVLLDFLHSYAIMSGEA